VSLNEILEAREARWARRLELAAGFKNGGAVLTLTLRLPSALRSSAAYEAKALRIFECMLQALTSERMEIQEKEFHVGPDGPEGFAAILADALRVKKLALRVEDNHPWGALADIDVMDHNGAPLGRSAFNLAPRRCLVCDREAALCVMERRHSMEEIQLKVDRIFSLTDEKASL